MTVSKKRVVMTKTIVMAKVGCICPNCLKTFNNKSNLNRHINLNNCPAIMAPKRKRDAVATNDEEDYVINSVDLTGSAAKNFFDVNMNRFVRILLADNLKTSRLVRDIKENTVLLILHQKRSNNSKQSPIMKC